MNSKIAKRLAKLLLEEDEDDIIKFSFPNEKRKIKCSISILSEVSPVFETMFSGRWYTKDSAKFPDADQIISEECNKFGAERIIELDDQVNFDQYLTFKLFIEIIYGLHKIESIDQAQAIAVYFYWNKYQVTDVDIEIMSFFFERLNSALSVTELHEIINFQQTYQLPDLKVKLDEAVLGFHDESPLKFFELASKFDMNELKQKVIEHLKNIPPQEDWTPEICHLVIKCLQDEKSKYMIENACNCRHIIQDSSFLTDSSG